MLGSILNAIKGPLMHLIRGALMFVGAALVSKGYLDQSGLETIVGGIMTVISALLVALHDAKFAKVPRDVAAQPIVQSAIEKAKFDASKDPPY
jgi:hypothetical protein